MYKILLMIIVLLLNFSFAKINISGKVVNAKGHTPIMADAHISIFGESVYSPLESKKIDKNGSFSFELKDGQYYTLYITAANHVGYQIPIITDEKNLDLKVKIKLDAISYKDEFESVKIVGDWNEFKFRSADDMFKQNDGTFLFEVKSDSDKVGYQILDIDENGHSVNGTLNDELEYDGGGDYKSFVKTKDGVAKIILDPAKLIRGDGEGAIVSIENSESVNKIAQINHKVNADQNQWRIARSAYNEKHKTTDGFEYDFEPIAKYLENNMEGDNKLIQRYSAIRYVSTINYGYKNGNNQRVAELLAITDPLWAANNLSIIKIYISALGKEKTDQLIKENFDKITSRKVKAAILALQGLDAKKDGNIEKVKEIHAELKTNYADQSDLRWYVNQIDPGAAVFIGKQVPEFEVKLLHNDEVVSRESMLGNFYIIDFWAVWCAPCRAEMPNLHAVYEEFKDKDFTILSLSFDPKVEHVDKYRKEKWAMPWLHTFVEGGFNNEVSKRFEVSGIPKPVLVDDKGIIVATDLELRGENLRETLNKYINTTM